MIKNIGILQETIEKSNGFLYPPVACEDTGNGGKIVVCEDTNNGEIVFRKRKSPA